MAKKSGRSTIELDGFDEIVITRTRHSEPTLYVNTADAKYPIARLSMGALTLLRKQVGDGEDVRVRVLHNAKANIAILVLDENGYTLSENGGLSGGAFAAMLGDGIKAKFPVELLNDGVENAPHGLRFSTVTPLLDDSDDAA